MPEILFGEVSELADEHDVGFANSNVNVEQLLNTFLKSRRQGTSPNTILYYKRCFTPSLTFYDLKSRSISEFISNLDCNPGENIWYMKPGGIQNILLEPAKTTGLPCNPHRFQKYKKGFKTILG